MLFANFKQQSRSYERIFSTNVTLWCMVFMRLSVDHTLDGAVTSMHFGLGDKLGKAGKSPISKRIISRCTAAFCQARKRLSLRFIFAALRHQSTNLQVDPKHLWRGMRIVIIDGSTLRLRPLGIIPKVFKPSRNQHGESYWCLARVTALICLHSGTVLESCVSKTKTSETTLGARMLRDHPVENSLLIADRGFGIFSVVQSLRHSNMHFLLRLTDSRARKLAGSAALSRPGSYLVTWTPTDDDKLTPRCDKSEVQGRFIVARLSRKGFRTQWLYLFCSLTDVIGFSDDELVELYRKRWLIEVNLRYLKSDMNLAQFQCKSTSMFMKEWHCGILAYNLVRHVMYLAALENQQDPQQLSFSGARRHLVDWLKACLLYIPSDSDFTSSLLRPIASKSLPQRSKPRPSEPRRKRLVPEPFPPLRGLRKDARDNLQKVLAES
jgi:hypothetical protein